METGDPGAERVLDGDAQHVTAEHAVVDVMPRPATVRVDDGLAGPLGSHEVPFQGPDPRAVLVDSPEGFDWRILAERIGRWPVLIVAGVALLAMLFAAFISSNSQTLGQNLDEELADAALDTTAPDNAAVRDTVPGLPASDSGEDESGGDGDGRSTGSAGEFDQSDGMLSESEEDLTVDISWVTPGIDTPATTTTNASTSVASTTPSTTAAPPGLSILALTPGFSSSGNPELVFDDSVRLRSEATGGQGLRYRFQIFEWNEQAEEWEQISQSRWSRNNELRFDAERHVGETIRWVAQVRDRQRNRADSDPLYFRVATEDEQAIGALTTVSPGDFDGIVLGDNEMLFVNDDVVPGWKSSNGLVEVWTSEFSPSIEAASGAQFIELNSTGPSTITQVVAVNPGSVVRWSLAHRSRQVPDESIEVQISPIDGKATTVGPLAAPLGSWVRHSGVYEVPADVLQIEFRIRALTSGSVGNFIDDVRIESAD